MSEPDERLDLRGVPCPANAAKALLQIAMMDAGQLLELLLDDGEPMGNVPPALEEEGHAVIERRPGEQPGSWAVVVKVGG